MLTFILHPFRPTGQFFAPKLIILILLLKVKLYSCWSNLALEGQTMLLKVQQYIG